MSVNLLLACLYIYIYIYIVVKMIEFSENKVLNIVDVELWQLMLHLLLHIVTLFHIRPWSSDRCRGRLGSVFIISDVGAIDVDGLTWRKVDTSNLRFNSVAGFAWQSNITTFSSRHKLHSLDRHWQVLDWRWILSP